MNFSVSVTVNYSIMGQQRTVQSAPTAAVGTTVCKCPKIKTFW